MLNSYRGKRVLVTGHTGFKGSWLSLWLKMLGAEVIGYSLYSPSEPANFDVLGLANLMIDCHGDVEDYQQLKACFDTHQPDIVFHLAAQSLVRESYKNPRLTFSTNVMGTVNVLDCIHNSDSVTAGVIITSDKAYRNVEWAYGYRENDALGGDDPYSGSKGAAELAIHSYMQSYFATQSTKNIASTRAGNVIGGGDWAEDRLVPDCIRAWATGTPVTIRSPHATRPWQHVLEPLSGYLRLGEDLMDQGSKCRNQSYNFGPADQQTYTVKAFLELLKHDWDHAKIHYQEDKSNMKEAGLLKLCCDKALHELGWQPTLNLHETITFINEWYRAFYIEEKDMLALTENQIERYMDKNTASKPTQTQ